MTCAAQMLLEELTRAGVKLEPAGDRLRFDAPAGVLTQAHRAAMVQHKPVLLALLAGDWATALSALLAMVPDPESRAALVERFEERAGICEFDAGMSRADAEHAAYGEVAAVLESA